MVFSHESIWLQDMLNSKAANANVEEVNGHQDVPDTKITTVEAKEKDTSSWKAEMFCRGVFKEDGLEYEGLIKSIESTENGQYAVVEFIGYGNQECIWLQDLFKSKGEKARQKQNKEANSEVIVTAGKYDCNDCGKKFRDNCNLKRHIDGFHLGLKPYKCEICDKKFSTQQNMSRHALGHENIIFHCDMRDSKYRDVYFSKKN